MATRTRNYNLIKPEGADLVDIDDLNGNFDVIDTQLKSNADAAAGKQDKLTFDTSPTQGSTRPVTSGGIYTALLGKQNTLTFDSTPTSGSSKPVTSGGIYTALGRKQNTLIFDSSPYPGSYRPVYSSGIYYALLEKQDDLTQVPEVSSLRDSDYLFLERGGAIYKIRASMVIIPSGGGEGIETENGDALLTEDGEELLIESADDEPGAAMTESGERLLTEGNEAITIDQ